MPKHAEPYQRKFEGFPPYSKITKCRSTHDLTGLQRPFVLELAIDEDSIGPDEPKILGRLFELGEMLLEEISSGKFKALPFPPPRSEDTSATGGEDVPQ